MVSVQLQETDRIVGNPWLINKYWLLGHAYPTMGRPILQTNDTDSNPSNTEAEFSRFHGMALMFHIEGSTINAV
jgi:hypothetical protein